MIRHPAERGGEERGRFARLAEAGSNLTSSPVFFGLCLLLVAGFVAVHLAGLSLAAQLVAGDAMTAVTLLLLALLKNAERRAELAVQRKLDAIAQAMLHHWDQRHDDARESLEQAIRLEDQL